ncbi:MAG: HlyD family efflux transporter periplasmic adaptor subunit [Acidobacteria bacterium]|nr:HlyD family efflux transporter periplasmic adaptor subunit [Acidobacteriota bacterium]
MTPTEVVPTPPAQRRQRFRTHTLPVVVWGVAALAATAMLLQRARQYEHLGLAQAFRHEVSVAVDGTIAEVLVQPLARVEAGEVVARLDDRMLAAELDAARHSLEQARMEAGAARAGLAGTGVRAAALVSDLRRFQADEEQRRLAVLELEALVDGDQVALERLALDAGRALRLAGEGVIPASEADAARLLRDETAARLERNRSRLEQAGREQARAAERRRRFEAGIGGGAGPPLDPLLETVDIQGALVRQLEAQLAALTVRAPVSGEVAQVLVRPGQSVTPGEPIAIVVPTETTEIVSYLAEAEARSIPAGSVVRVARRADPSRAADSVVARVGSTVELMPNQLWRDPRVPEYGLPISIPAPSALALTPGEGVLIRVDSSR